MYDDSLSFEWVNQSSRSDIWHHGKKCHDRSILRKLVAQDALNATHPSSSLSPSQRLQTPASIKPAYQGTVNHHPAVHHPLDASYYSVVDEPQLTIHPSWCSRWCWFTVGLLRRLLVRAINHKKIKPNLAISTMRTELLKISNKIMGEHLNAQPRTLKEKGAPPCPPFPPNSAWALTPYSCYVLCCVELFFTK